MISANGDTITFTATAPGVYPFNYQVTDNFGCTYDTTITVCIDEPFDVEAEYIVSDRGATEHLKQTADENNIDLVLMGGYGGSKLQQVFNKRTYSFSRLQIQRAGRLQKRSNLQNNIRVKP